MSGLPTGIVTVLFSDIEGSTRMLQRLGDRYGELLEEHQRLLRTAFNANRGHEVGTQGDAFFVAFESATDAIAAAIHAQRALHSHRWAEGERIVVRMGIHTGTPTLVGDDYWGLDIHRAARICSAAQGGQILVSEDTRAAVDAEGHAELGLWDLGLHRLKDLAEPEHLYQVIGEGLPESFPPIQSLETPSNLPALSSSFIGRERELGEVRGLIRQDGVRLVTLIGPGGTGKSRLALQAADSLLRDFPDGVFLVNLAPLDDATLVADTIAQTLGVRQHGADSIITEIKRHLQRRAMLLLLDNFEHVLEAAPLVTDLLGAAPKIKVLTTSRSALRVAGEQEYPVAPLPIPARVVDLETAESFDSVSLFLQRARAVRPDFNPTAADVPTLVEICERLDGLPLALELAAARVKLLPLPALASRLDKHLQLLTGGGPDRPQRQQTLRAAIDWSYSLLDGDEQRLFRRFSAFMGGCTLDAAEVVLDGDVSRQLEIIDGVSSLLDKSLLTQGSGSVVENRLRMLRTVRDFAFEELLAQGEADEVRVRHARYFCELAEAGETELSGEHENDWLLRLDAEDANMRAALSWLLEGDCASDQERALLALRLAGALGKFWYRRARLVEGSRWLEAALAVCPEGFPKERAKTVYMLGVLLEARAQQQRAVDLFEECLALYRELGDEHSVARTLNSLGVAVSALGQFRQAEVFLEESIALKEKAGDLDGVATSLGNLAVMAVEEGHLERARELLERSIEICRRVEDGWGIAIGKGNLAVVALDQGDVSGARDLVGEALAGFWQVGDLDGVAEALETSAAIAVIQDDPVRSARLAGAAERLRDDLDSRRRPVDQVWLDRHLDEAREALGPRYQDESRAGRGLSLEAASELALLASPEQAESRADRE